MTPREVREELASESDLAYTTVMTVLSRLWKKGYLERQRDGLAFAYRTLETREEWAAGQMRQALSAGGNQSRALMHFVEAMDAAEQDQLRRLLQRRRGDASRRED